MKGKLHRIAGGLVCLLPLPALALQLELLPLPVATNANSSFDLVLQISGLAADQQVVSSFDVLLTFDPAVVHATGVTFGTNLGGPLNSLTASDHATAGQLQASEVTFLSDAELLALQPDTLTLATLRFVAFAAGTTSIEITSALLTGLEDPLAPGFATLLDPALAGTRVSVLEASEPESLALALAAWIAAAWLRSRRTPRP